jgi:hypothetical protein
MMNHLFNGVNNEAQLDNRSVTFMTAATGSGQAATLI